MVDTTEFNVEPNNEEEEFTVDFGEVTNIGGGGTSDFNALSNRPKYNSQTMTGNTNIPAVPTKTSDLDNDAGYQTSSEVESAISTAIDEDLATVAVTGSYDDLIDTPTIPTVNDATLTITQNGTSKGTFTANDADDTTIEVSDTTYSDFMGTDGVTAGTAGLVPAPQTTDTDKFLKSDGTWDTAGGGSSVNVVQTTGTSTTDVMSQNAVSTTLFDDLDGQTRIQIGNGANGHHSYNPTVAIGRLATSTGGNSTAIGSGSKASASHGVAIGSGSAEQQGSIAIGRASMSSGLGAIAIGGYGGSSNNAYTNKNGSIAIGVGAAAEQAGEMNIGDRTSTYGYNNSAYRLLSGLYDGQSAHDAATKGQLDAVLSYSETEINTGATWIDGKTIYKKSYQQTITSNSQGFNLNITNLYEIVKIEAIWHIGGTLTNGIPTTFATTSSLSDNVTVLTYGGQAEIMSNGRNGTKGVITFYYTKTS